MRIVLDTNTVFSALLWRGKPYQILEAVRTSSLQLCASTPMLEELADVLSRPSASKRLALIDRQVHDVLRDYVSVVEIVEPVTLAQPACRDPDDDVVLATALAAHADLIISGDDDLLVLHPFEHIPILNASNALDFIAAAR